ncbi:class I SAM-dependent methyltransferase [Paraburkholderia sp. B3]|uniref:class I SAM-dependent methyltransferase n=1 Tax=Paraburkholderia sp. B3 TaxID=3134791 RepID=UPI003981A5DE
MISEEQHALYYAARAREYDASVGYGKAPVEAGLAPLKSHLADAMQGLDVLEIACGTGYWTRVAARTARSVLAVDFDATSLMLAQARLARHDRVSFARADAYRLDGVPAHFNGAFGMFWWSHMPRTRIGEFIDALHARLAPGSRVVFADQLPYAHPGARRVDERGDLIEERALFDGTRFEVVKNFPTAQQMSKWLAGRASGMEFFSDPNGRWWFASYRTV